MAATPSTMLPLGTPAPAFALPDVTTGETVRLEDFLIEQPLLVMFLCRHCPYVQHVQAGLAQLGRDYAGRVGMVAIGSNDAQSHPGDAPPGLRQQAAEQGFTFPYCYDETQQVARAYHAACTPDFFLFDDRRRLAYRGQLDASRPGNGVPVTGADLRAAMDALLAGQPVSAEQRPSLGCSIKWKAA